jgi:hypothetical protein
MHIGRSPPCGLPGTKVIASSILGGLPVRSFDAIASASVYQSNFSLLMKFRPIVCDSSQYLARTGKISPSGRTLTRVVSALHASGLCKSERETFSRNSLVSAVVLFHVIPSAMTKRQGPISVHTVGYIERKSQWRTCIMMRRERTSDRPP